MPAGPEASGERVEVRDAAAVLALFRRLEPEVVIHTAYRQDGPEAWGITVDGAEHVARAAAAVRARLVHLSTDVVFDGRKGTPYVEDDPPSPATEYGRAKAESEARVKAACADALLVRTSLIVGGPGHEPSKQELLAAQPGVGFYEDEIRCPVQVGDLAAALLELAVLDVSRDPCTSLARTPSRGPVSPSSSRAAPCGGSRRLRTDRSTARSTPRGLPHCCARGSAASASCFTSA